MVAYFCNHLSGNFIDWSYLYGDLSVIYVYMSDHYVDLSEKNNITTSSLKLLLTAIYLSIWYLTSQHYFLTSRYNDIQSYIFFSCDGIAIQILVPKGKSITVRYYQDIKLNKLKKFL